VSNRVVTQAQSRSDRLINGRGLSTIARLVRAWQVETKLRANSRQNSVAASSPGTSTPVALREGILYVRVLQPTLHYELEQISKSEILRKLKQRFGAKTIRDVRFRVW